MKRLLVLGLGLVASAAMAKDSTPVNNVENPDRYPYYEFASATIAAGYANNFINFPTPAGSRYFIEQVSVSCTTSSDSDIFTEALLGVLKVTSNSNLGFASPVVTLEKRGPSAFGGYLWTGSAHVKVISDASPFSPDGSGALYIDVFHTDASGPASCFATLFGHSLPL